MNFIHNNFDKNLAGIYRITNNETLDVYIGSTNCFARRYKEHLITAVNDCHVNDHLRYSFSKYGVENFSFEILEPVLSLEKMIQLEQIWIDWYAGLNRKALFNASLVAGKVDHSPEIRKKISKTKLAANFKYSEGSKQKMRNAYYSNEKHRLALLKQNHEKRRGYVQNEEERRNSEIAGYRAAFRHRKISDKDVIEFIHRFTSEEKLTASSFAKEKGVSTSTIANIFKKLKSKGNDYLAIFKPILFKIGYVDAGGDGVADLKKPEIFAKLDLNIKFQDGSDNLINDPVELYHFIQQD